MTPAVHHSPAPDARHVPVLMPEVLAWLSPREGGLYVDGTFGAGGYTRAILQAAPCQVIAIDRDPVALAIGRSLEQQFAPRLAVAEGRFADMEALVQAQGHDRVDGVVLDIGVSSMQLDQAERGFSFRADGPLDMRMAQAGVSAADVVNTFAAGDLARIFNFLGEERNAGRIARMIEARRAKRPFETTLDLAQAIETHVGRKPGERIHPATRVFQALRIFVNDELGELARALLASEKVLSTGGRLVVVSFHSLEDRIVKRFIADRSEQPAGSRHLPQVSAVAPTFEKMGGAVAASEAEIEINPRARSAKLRAARRTAAPARSADTGLFGLPKLPSVSLH